MARPMDGTCDGSAWPWLLAMAPIGSGWLMAAPGIKTNSDEVFLVDNIETIIKSIKGNTAKGFIVETDLTLIPCFLVKANGLFAHGKLQRSSKELRRKPFQELDEDERLDEFVKHFLVLKNLILNKES